MTTNEELQSLSSIEWENERRRRVNALAASLTRANEALEVLPSGYSPIGDQLARSAAMLRGDLRLALNLRNPFERGQS